MNKHILVVDDDPAILIILRDRLRSYGYTVTTAYDGRAALESIKKEEPDCVLLDLEMPEMSGFEVLEVLGRTHSHLPVLVVTASASKPSAKKALEAGATGYILKPFDPGTLKTEVARILNPDNDRDNDKA